jgi:hypothetical protein
LLKNKVKKKGKVMVRGYGKILGVEGRILCRVEEL